MSLVNLKSNYSTFNKDWLQKLKSKDKNNVNTQTAAQRNKERYFNRVNPIDSMIGNIPDINRNFGNSSVVTNGIQKQNTPSQNKGVQIPSIYQNINKFNTDSNVRIPDKIIKPNNDSNLEGKTFVDINKDVKQVGNVTTKDNNINYDMDRDVLQTKPLVSVNKNISQDGRHEQSSVELIKSKFMDISSQSSVDINPTKQDGRHENSNTEVIPTKQDGRHKNSNTEVIPTNTIEHKSFIEINYNKSNVDITTQSSFNPVFTQVGTNNNDSDIVLFKPNTSGNNEVSNINIIKSELVVDKKIPITVNTDVDLIGVTVPNINAFNNTPLQGRHENSNFNPNIIPISGQFLGETTPFNTSKLSGRHIVDTSILNIDGTPTGVNFFSDINSNGFTIKQTQSNFNTESSRFVWSGTNIPEVNFFSDEHFEGFKKYSRLYQTFLVNRNSKYTFVNEPQSVNFFVDTNAGGFTLNMALLETEYNTQSSIYVWSGDSSNSPTSDFFSNLNVTEGFHKFAQLYDTKYLHESSKYVWVGNRDDAPSTDFFSNLNVTEGFHKFARLYDTKYLHESSKYVWVGDRTNSPSTDFFSNLNVTEGFHKFAQLYDTKYLHESSIYVWSGTGTDAPSVDYFNNTHNTGFTKFVKMYETEYKRDVSIYVWSGTGNDAPETNFFVNTYNTGFTKFVQLYDTEFKNGTSIYVWDGTATDAPETNFFVDTYNTGFTKFASQLETEFKNGTSTYVWNGTSTDAPSTNFFTNTYNTGFTKFVSQLETEFIQDTSKYVWGGGSSDAPAVDFFNNDKVAGFDTFFDGDTKYDHTKSIISLLAPDKYDVTPTTSELEDDIPSEENITPTPYAPDGGGINSLRDNSPTVEFYNTPGTDASTKFGQMYTKFSLRDDSYNPDLLGSHPFIVRGFQDGSSEEVERWGYGAGFDEGLVRGGATVNAERSVTDVVRMAKFMASGKGLLTIAKNVGLYLSNPDTETHPTVSSPIGSLRNTQLYNPLSVTLQAGVGDKGSHLLPFGINPTDAYPRYEDVAKDRNDLSDVKVLDAIIPSALPGDQGQQNRLLMLTKELFPSHLKLQASLIPDFSGKIINKLSSKNGGVGSTYGIGPTLITRAVNTRNMDNVNDYIFNVPTFQYNSSVNNNSIRGTKNIDTFKVPRPEWEKAFQQSVINRYLYFAEGPGKALESDTSRQFTLRNPFIKTHTNDKNTELNKPAQNATLPSNVELGLKNYQTLAYEKLNREVFLNPPNSNAIRKFNDFRLGLDNDETKGFSSDPNVENYKENNLEDKYGIGEPGKVSDGSTPNRSNHKLITGNADKVNLIDFKTTTVTTIKDVYGEVHDLIDFYFTGTDIEKGDDLIVFRAILGSISDTFSPSWSSQTYIGRADPVYVYNSFERSVSFDLKVVATSNEELKPMWRKLNALASYTGPEYTKAGLIRGPVLRLTLGNLFQKTPVFIESLSYTMDNASNTWEINKQDEDVDQPATLQVPKVVDVSLGLKIIGNFRPQVRGTMYSLFETDAVGKPIANKKSFFTEEELGEVADESQYNAQISGSTP